MLELSLNYILSLKEIKELKISLIQNSKDLTLLKKSFYQENFTQTLNSLIELSSNVKLSESDERLLKFLEINIYIHNKEIEKALNLIMKLEKEFITNSDQYLELIYNIQKAYVFALNKKNDECIILLDKLENDLKEITNFQNFKNEQLAIVSLIRGINYRELGKFNQAIEYFGKSLKIRYSIDNNETEFLLFLLGSSNLHSGNYIDSIKFFELALHQYQKGEENIHKIQNQNRFLRIYNNIGLSNWKLGDLNLALLNYEKALKFTQNVDTLIVALYVNLALIYWEKGELEKALDYNFNSLKLLKKMDNKPYLTLVFNNIGNIYENKGEMELSLDYYTKSLLLAKEIGDQYKLALVLNNLGELYQSKGDFEKSYENYKKGYQTFSDLKADVDISITLHNLINISLILHNEKETNKFLNQLENIKSLSDDNSKLIKSTFDLSLANVKKSSKRFIDISQAQNIYYEILASDIIKHEHKVEAILQLSELLLMELKFSGRESVLKELTDLINELFDIAKKQNSFLLLCHSYMLLGKIAILNFDPASIEKAKELLSLSLSTAEERGYKHLTRKISFEMENQQKIINKINSTDKSKLTLDYLLELTEIEEYVTKIIKNKITSLPLDVDDEDPTLLLLLGNSGIPLFSYAFGKPEDYDSMLIGGFMSAINIFFQQTFATENMIERISHKDYTVLFRPYGEVIFCYVFKGPNLKAVDRFDSFINTLLASESFKESLSNSLKTGRILNKNKVINGYLNEFFKNNIEKRV